ncbi:hypothetical protein [Alkalicoccus halolimnae]|uniref:Uncharacterized protein n=1 Tax=Alkalicoccus halolimnae TaxID=1667239 RepID=A0A5C7F0F4_9BACI|nr:hypothetical protein [Alkalicoccus halolimnae]TXF82566.1 hypothetical protein FTX54_14620 [Alkalicoccus halolimnae]
MFYALGSAAGIVLVVVYALLAYFVFEDPVLTLYLTPITGVILFIPVLVLSLFTKKISRPTVYGTSAPKKPSTVERGNPKRGKGYKVSVFLMFMGIPMFLGFIILGIIYFESGAAAFSTPWLF